MTDSVSCVNTEPNVFPIAAPRGAPAANVENAMARIRDGGNECARIPSCVALKVFRVDEYRND